MGREVVGGKGEGQSRKPREEGEAEEEEEKVEEVSVVEVEDDCRRNLLFALWANGLCSVVFPRIPLIRATGRFLLMFSAVPRGISA